MGEKKTATKLAIGFTLCHVPGFRMQAGWKRGLRRADWGRGDKKRKSLVGVEQSTKRESPQGLNPPSKQVLNLFVICVTHTCKFVIAKQANYIEIEIGQFSGNFVI